MKTLPTAQPRSPGSDTDGADHHVNSQSIVIPAKLNAMAESFEKREHSWIATSEIPTDLSVQVQDITFNVHKYPLVSRCGFLGRISLQANSSLGYDFKLENFPGGSEIFEIIVKFCYGLPVGLSPNNVAPLRCASEFLEMTEALEDGNLISKTEAFLTFVVLSSWRDSIIVLKSCETLSPWAENLQIVRRCCDSIAWKASQDIPSIGEMTSEESWWFDDVATLRIDHFMRIITAIKAKGMNPAIIGSCIMHYAEKWLQCMDVELEGVGRYGYMKNELQLSILSGRRQEGVAGHNKEQRIIIESLVSMLPPQKETVSCKFLLWMLKMAMVYSASQALISELEKRVGMVLENATANDLMIPSCKIGDQGNPMNSPVDQTMHNIDVVQRILEYFLMHEQQQQQPELKAGKVKVSKLLDNYLAEIARDPNLSIPKFQFLAETLPENSRTCHDGLYRAIDIYLKTHPSLSEHDRRRICKVMDCTKLSLDACMHAAQNDRLPLRTVIEVLFSEQVKIRAAMQGKEQAASGNNSDEETSWSSMKKEIKMLKAELEKVKMEMGELQRDYTELQHEYEKLTNKQRNLPSWTFGWRKFKNSTLFHGKVNGDGNGEDQQRSNLNGRRVGFNRRQSIS